MSFNENKFDPKPLKIAFDLTKGQGKRIILNYKILQSLIINKGMILSTILQGPLKIRFIEQYDVLIISTFVFWSLFRISCFVFRIFDRKNGVFGQALTSVNF